MGILEKTKKKRKVSAATSRIRTCEPPSPQLIHHPDIHYFYFDIGQTCDAVPRRKDVLRSYSCRVSELSKENTSRQHFFVYESAVTCCVSWSGFKFRFHFDTRFVELLSSLSFPSIEPFCKQFRSVGQRNCYKSLEIFRSSFSKTFHF